MTKQETQPEKSLGLRRTPLGWSVVKSFLHNGRVVREEKSEPEMKAFALERLRTEMVDFWESED